MKKMKIKFLWVVLICLTLVVAACQPASEEPLDEQAEAQPAEGVVEEADEAVEEVSPAVGIFVDNAFGDRAFFDIALDGIPLIEGNYNATVTKYEGRLQPDNFTPILSDAAENNDLVFVLGFEAIDAMFAAAAENPETLFVFIDAPLESEDLSALAYKDHEGCFVAGALAASLTVDTSVENINDEKVIGFVGGVDAPVIRKCESGYIQGAAYIDPEVVVETIFVGSFVDPAKGKEANLALIDKGSDINYQYAGLSGEGGFNAAKEGSPLYVIGAGFDQSWMAPDQTIGSMLKRVDLSIEYLTGLFVNGELGKGEVFFWGIAEDGVPFVFSEDIVPAEIVENVSQIQEQIKSGEIVVEE